MVQHVQKDRPVVHTLEGEIKTPSPLMGEGRGGGEIQIYFKLYETSFIIFWASLAASQINS
jgi:hypothetical protein